ncbi:alpha/beta hydrolase [Gordonia liuliyuniae]|uniref:Alpha/beta hydrolase n=1 Tax=Gordonia liuliyuniae TaxID=2911517 RepID=A0ABS9IUI5_9ACTN|nr:alpha/beta hydrolase [Gordonia liuliyuniae]MCF8589224.1 alpha/beta hydrolase [Gordonia liuliyuniae]
MTSVRAKLLIARMRIQRNKRFYADPATMRRRLSAHQSPRRARPPAWMRRRYRVEEVLVHDHHCFTLSPRDGVTSDWHLFHMHGGGFVESPEPHHWRFAAWMVDRLGCRYTMPMYPLTPSHDHRTIVPMVEEAYRTLMAPTAPKNRLVIGDSAGGTLALGLTRHLREQDLEQPAGVALFSPWIDLATDDAMSVEIDPSDPELGVTGLRQAGRWFAGARALDDPEVSPAFADLDGSAPVVVFIGHRDILLPDARRIKQLGDDAGVRIELNEYPGMFHNWIMQPIPEGQSARAELLDFIGSLER